MSLRIPPNDPSLSPSPHRHITQFQRHHSPSPCSSNSPSPASSPLKFRRGKHSQMDSTEDEYNRSPLRNSQSRRQASQLHRPTPQSDENIAILNADHQMPDFSPSSSTPIETSTSVQQQQEQEQEQQRQLPSHSRHRRPLSISFTNNDPSFSKRLATSHLHPSGHGTSPIDLSFNKSTYESADAPLPRGLRRSTGLLNLDEASLGSPLTRKSSYRARKSHVKHSSSSSTCSTYSNSSGSSASSIHSDISRASTPPPNPFATRMTSTPVSQPFTFNLDSHAPNSMPLKRSHGFFSESVSATSNTNNPKWNFGSETKPKWQFNQQNQSSSSTGPSPFYRQPFFSTNDSSTSPFPPPQFNRKLNSASDAFFASPSSTSKSQKIRKMNSIDSLHPTSSSSPKFTNSQHFSTHPTHPLAYSLVTSPSPSPGPKNQSRPATPGYPNRANNPSPSPAPSSTSASTVDASITEPPKHAFTTYPKQPFKINSALEADISTGSIGSSSSSTNSNSQGPPEYSTPNNYRFVKPLQTAFLSTGLLSKRNRRKPVFNEEHRAPPDTPCKKPLGLPMTPGPSQLSTNTKKLFGNTFYSSPRSLPRTLHGGANSNNSDPFGRSRFSMDFGGFYDSQFNEPSTPTKRDSHFNNGDNNQIFSSMPMKIPSRATKQISETSTVIPATFASMSTTPTSSNSSSTSINHISSTPHSQSSRWLDGSPSEHSSPRTPEVAMNADVPQFSLIMEPNEYPQGNVLHCDEENHEMEDVTDEPPKTPAKPSKLSGDIAIPSTIMALEKQENAVDVVLRERYADVEMIGKGEFSIVYAASEKSNNTGIEPVRYAIKRTKFPFVGPKARARRSEEVEILRNLTYPNHQDHDDGKEYIVNLMDAWELRGHLYIVTEYCENGNLDSFLSERGNVSRLDEWRVWKILVEITLGLQYIHNEGYIHLDMKPANVFITFEGTLKIGDFGMAAKLPVPPGIEREGDREYIAPELLSRHMYDKPADIFSTGLMMLEIAANIILPDNGIHWQKLRSGDLSDAGRLSSRNLCTEDDENDDETTGLTSPKLPPTTPCSEGRRHSHAPPLWAPKFMVDNTGALDRIVKWMLSPEPYDRPTAQQILATEEAQWVETYRKAGAVVYEGDYGPTPESSNGGQVSSMAQADDVDVKWRRGL